MSTPTVSIVVPVFNAEATIGACLESVVVQSFQDWDCVVVDDGSNDRGPEIAGGFAARDSRIRVVRQPNTGLPGARNTGIVHAKGAWVRFLDADDWLLNRSHETLLEAARRSGGALVAGGARYVSESGEDLGWSFRPGIEAAPLEVLVEAHRFQVSAAMVRREALAGTPFRDDAAGSEDLDVWLRLCEAGVTPACTDADVVAYRLRHAGMSRDHAKMARVAARVIAACFERCPGLEEVEPGKRSRCLRRVALERASALSLTHGPDAGAAQWRSASIDPDRAPTSAEAASAACWSVPYADCLPPTAWRDDAQATRYLRALSGLWDALGVEPFGAIRSLAALIVEPRAVAENIAASVDAGRGVVILGLGRNAAVLVPVLARNGIPVFGCDGTASPGTTRVVGGVPVPVISPREATRNGVPVLTAWSAPALEGAIGGRCLKWAESAADISLSEFERLRALTPRDETIHLQGRAA